MSTVKELIEYLRTLPPDMEVFVLKECSGTYYTYTEWESLDLREYFGNVEVLLDDLHIGNQ